MGVSIRYAILTLLLLAACAAPEFTVDPMMSQGNPQAPVTVVAFNDYECPFCRQFAAETLPSLLDNYVDDGLVHLVYKDFPLAIHEHAIPAAVAARCAGAQGEYFSYAEHLFNATLADEPYERIAEEQGLELDAFAACRADPAVEAAVRADLAEGKAARVQGTPTFFINGEKVAGPRPFKEFAFLIEEARGRPANVTGDVLCASDDECPEPRVLGPYCGHNEPASCTASVSYECEFPNTTLSSCIPVVVEECTPCACNDGECAAS